MAISTLQTHAKLGFGGVRRTFDMRVTRADILDPFFAVYRSTNRLIARTTSAAALKAQDRSRACRFFFVLHNANHFNILHPSMVQIANAGFDVCAVVLPNRRDYPVVRNCLNEAGIADVPVTELPTQVGIGDVVCTCSDGGPPELRAALGSVARRGAHLVGVVEGARYSRRQFQRAHTVLCWGPSGEELWRARARIAGSPIIEGAHGRSRVSADLRHVLINYKFQPGETDHDFAWAHAAIDAARGIDPNTLVSVHPRTYDVPSGLTPANQSLNELLPQASLLVSRASTVIYEALAMNIPVIYFPAPGENRAEFADFGATFPVAETAQELIDACAAFARHETSFANPASFLDQHLSIDPNRSASARISDYLLQLAGGT
ncbi:MAG: hypothetical protein AAF732_18350 [Pseudomonadota bacterium]